MPIPAGVTNAASPAPAPPISVCHAAWIAALVQRLGDARSARLDRSLRVPDPHLVDLASNDYLGLRLHPHLTDAVADAARRFGVGAGASRLVSGTTDLHERVEARLARFKNAEAALVLPTGYAANLALIAALPNPGDLILMDRLNHASLIDAARAAAAGPGRVTLGRFRHRDADNARTRARRHLARHPNATVWLVSDSVFSMDGDIAPVRELARLRDEISQSTPGGCCLILDEAHATGLLGPTGAGADEAAGHVADICVSTASKALGSLGGIITGPRVVIDAVTNFARPFIYTTAAPPTQLAGIEAALDVVRDEPERRSRVARSARALRAALIEKNWPRDSLGEDPIPIVPLVVGEPDDALSLSEHLADAGFFAPAIRPPSVPAGACRVRLSLNANLADADLARLIDAIPSYNRVLSTPPRQEELTTEAQRAQRMDSLGEQRSERP